MTISQTAAGLRPLAVVLLLTLVLAGCRSYGGYGSEEATMEQIRKANQLFAESLQRAQADLNVLERAAESEASLGPAVQEYQRILLIHEALLAENRELADDVAGQVGFDWSTLELGSYRKLNRVLGAVTAEQKMINQQYTSLRNALLRPGDTVQAVRRGEYEEGRYAITPIYYARVRNAAAPLTMREVLRLRAARGSDAPPPPAVADSAASVASDVPGAVEGGVVQPEATPRGVQQEQTEGSAADTSNGAN